MRKIGPYIITKKLTHSDFGMSYLAMKRMGRFFSYQVVLKRHPCKQKDVTRFIHQAYLLSTLRHPNLITLLDFFTHRRHHIMAYEYIPGWDIHDLIEHLKRHKLPMPLLQTCLIRILEQSLRGITFMHQNQWVHGDIHPRNIRMSPFLEIKLIDFGSAQPFHASQPTPTISMRPGWTAPETIKDGIISSTGDFYSFAKLIQHVVQTFPALKPHKPFAPLMQAAEETFTCKASDRSMIWNSLQPLLLQYRTALDGQHLDKLQKSISKYWQTSETHATIHLQPIPAYPSRRFKFYSLVLTMGLLAVILLKAWPNKPVSTYQKSPNVSLTPSTVIVTKRPEKVSLLIQANPWSNIQINGKALGQTPILKRFQAKAFPLKIQAHYNGRTQTKLLKLSDVPPNAEPWVIAFEMQARQSQAQILSR